MIGVFLTFWAPPWDALSVQLQRQAGRRTQAHSYSPFNIMPACVCAVPHVALAVANLGAPSVSELDHAKMHVQSQSLSSMLMAYDDIKYRINHLITDEKLVTEASAAAPSCCCTLSSARIQALCHPCIAKLQLPLWMQLDPRVPACCVLACPVPQAGWCSLPVSLRTCRSSSLSA